jgi:hypothetical protein
MAVRASSRNVREGIVSGLIGAALVAVWLLIYHAAHLSSAETAAVAAGAHAVIRYTVFPAVVFAMIGILVTYVIVSSQDEPSRGLRAILSLLCLEVVALSALVWIANPLIDKADWWALLVGNLLAAGGMVVYFFRPRGLGRALVSELWTDVAAEGIAAGLVGAATVAVWCLLYDGVTATPFRIPALLGAYLLHDLRDPGALVITAPLVLEYTVVHGIAFVMFGCAVAGLLALADREPQLVYVVVALFCCFEVFVVRLIAIVAESHFDTLTWWPFLVANVLATLAMIAVFIRHHRRAWALFMAAS